MQLRLTKPTTLCGDYMRSALTYKWSLPKRMNCWKFGEDNKLWSNHNLRHVALGRESSNRFLTPCRTISSMLSQRNRVANTGPQFRRIAQESPWRSDFQSVQMSNVQP